MKRRLKSGCFIKDEHGVLGLPIRLTVSLIIGTVALVGILSFILNPCLFPGKMIVVACPMVAQISGEEPSNVTILVCVHDMKNHPIQGATVILKGLGGAGSGVTNEKGNTTVQLQVHIPQGLHEGYLTLSVRSAACYEPYEQQDLIKIVKTE
jgi:hypothetical protein